MKKEKIEAAERKKVAVLAEKEQALLREREALLREKSVLEAAQKKETERKRLQALLEKAEIDSPNQD